MSNIKPYQGECLCGIVKYSVDEIEPSMSHCHCSMCRKFHGAAFATYAKAKREKFHWISGESSLKEYISENGSVRKFCVDCGSSLMFLNDNSGNHKSVYFTAGSLITDTEARADVHIYTTSKANWVCIDDDLTKFDKDRGSTKLD